MLVVLLNSEVFMKMIMTINIKLWRVDNYLRNYKGGARKTTTRAHRAYLGLLHTYVGRHIRLLNDKTNIHIYMFYFADRLCRLMPPPLSL